MFIFCAKRLETLAPSAERLVVEALMRVAVPVAIMLATVKPFAERIDVEAVVAKIRVAVAFVVIKFVAVAFVAKRAASVAPDAERLVVEAFRMVAVPVVLVLVNEAPVAERFVVEALMRVAVPVAIMLATVNPLAERSEVEALVAVRFVMKPLVKVSPVPEMLVVEALPRVVCPATPRVPVK